MKSLAAVPNTRKEFPFALRQLSGTDGRWRAVVPILCRKRRCPPTKLRGPVDGGQRIKRPFLDLFGGRTRAFGSREPGGDKAGYDADFLALGRSCNALLHGRQWVCGTVEFLVLAHSAEQAAALFALSHGRLKQFQRRC